MLQAAYLDHYIELCSKIITNKMTLMDYPLFQGEGRLTLK